MKTYYVINASTKEVVGEFNSDEWAAGSFAVMMAKFYPGSVFSVCEVIRSEVFVDDN